MAAASSIVTGINSSSVKPFECSVILKSMCMPCDAFRQQLGSMLTRESCAWPQFNVGLFFAVIIGISLGTLCELYSPACDLHPDQATLRMMTIFLCL